MKLKRVSPFCYAWKNHKSSLFFGVTHEATRVCANVVMDTEEELSLSLSLGIDVKGAGG
jgi:hypothetical protein